MLKVFAPKTCFKEYILASKKSDTLTGHEVVGSEIWVLFQVGAKVFSIYPNVKTGF